MQIERQEELQINPADLKIEKKVGKGGFGTVYKGKLRGEPVAVKELLDKESADKEAAMLEMLHPYRHPNIVAYLGRSNSSIVMEWVPRTLNDIKSPSKARISKLLLGFVKGMAFVHELGFVHRDLKPSNVLVTKDDVVKIADFGIARELGNPKDMTTGIGTTYFMPNEQRRRASSGYNESVDVHSFGMTCNELINECQWNHPVMTELVKKCAMPKIDLGIRQQAKPQDRPSFQDILLILRQRFEQAKPAVLPKYVQPKPCSTLTDLLCLFVCLFVCLFACLLFCLFVWLRHSNLGQIKPRSYQRDDPGSDDATASDASGDESEAGDDDTIPDIGGGAAEKLPRVTPGSVSRQSWCPPANECPYCKDYRNGNRLHKACSLRPKAAPKPHNKPALHRKQIVKSLNTKPTECMDNLPRKTSGSSHRQSWCRSDDECRYCKDFQNGNRLRQACALKPPKL